MKKGLILLTFSSFLFSTSLENTKILVKEQKYKEALKSYMKIAEDGMIAKYNIGFMFENGLGVKKNINTAVRFYKMSADDGYAPAALLTANAYLKGVGFQRNLELAIYYYKIAAKEGNKEAIKILNILNQKLQSNQKKKKGLVAYLTLRSNVINDKVYIDGKYIGKTKIVVPVSANKIHHIEIKKDGYKPYIRNVKLKPNSKKTIRAVLHK